MASSEKAAVRPTFQHRLEYAAISLFVGVMRALPRGVARRVGAGLGWSAGRFIGRLRRTGDENLRLAYPASSAAEREQMLDRTFANLGRHLAEFCQMSGYSAEHVKRDIVRYEGLDHFLAAERRGRGVLVLTGHLGAWELSSFVHSLFGHPMGMVIRRLDNPLIDRMVNDIRCLHGNRVLHKDDFARGLLHAMSRGEAVGILMDTNMTPPQGVFVPFFETEACTASGLARVARKTGAAVLPGFLLWEESEARYVLRFGEELVLQHTTDTEADAQANTALFARVTEEYIRRYPDQWLWLHRRWKTRPAGEPPIYGRSGTLATAQVQRERAASAPNNGALLPTHNRKA